MQVLVLPPVSSVALLLSKALFCHLYSNTPPREWRGLNEMLREEERFLLLFLGGEEIPETKNDHVGSTEKILPLPEHWTLESSRLDVP